MQYIPRERFGDDDVADRLDAGTIAIVQGATPHDGQIDRLEEPRRNLVRSRDVRARVLTDDIHTGGQENWSCAGKRDRSHPGNRLQNAGQGGR